MKKDKANWVNQVSKRDDYDSVLPAFFAPNLILAYKEQVIGDSCVTKLFSRSTYYLRYWQEIKKNTRNRGSCTQIICQSPWSPGRDGIYHLKRRSKFSVFHDGQVR